MTCPRCGSENEAGRKFCLECGALLTATCPACAAANPPGAKFCGECGTSLLAASPVAPPPAPVAAPIAERRLVSILFVDLVDFTRRTESRDAEDVRDLQRLYFDRAREIVERYGGAVEKYAGDAVMAAWGTPVVHEDDAERAVRAALDVVAAIGQLGTDDGPRLEGRAAVLTGEAAVTLGSTDQGMVTGDLVNTASRLQTVAQPGTVVVGEPTRRATERSIAYEALGERVLKGKSAPVELWRPVGVVAGRRGAGRSVVLEPPFVGRDGELRLIKELLHATGAERRARLLSISGLAGIGKTRLAWELEKYVDGIAEQVWWHQGRSPAYGDGVTFWALGEMVRGRAGIAETDAAAVARDRLRDAVGAHIPDPEERRWIEPRLAALLALEEAPTTEQADLFAAWRAFFERLAERATTVLVFEDLQWADQGIFDFIESLMEWSKGHPLFVVTLARPEVMERRPTWGAGQRNFTAIHLDPLPSEAMNELLDGLAPRLPDSLRGQIVARAEGVPLYAVETVRMLIHQGVLEADPEGGYRAARDVFDLNIPESLRGLVAARIDALEPTDRSLLQAASVLGHSFTVDALASVAGLEGPAVKRRLAGLTRLEVMRLDADPRSPERGQFAFVQGVLREVAYGTLAKPLRRSLHVAAIRHFESVGSDEVASIVASHFLAAHRATAPGPEADALAAQARVALRGAGDRAAALHAHEQAIGFFEQALEVTTDEQERAELHERAGEAGRAALRLADAQRHLGEALASYRHQGAWPAVARTTAALAYVLHIDMAVEKTIPLLEGTLRDVEALGDDPGVTSLLGELTRAYMFAERFDVGLETAERALAMAERLELLAVIAHTLITKANMLDVDQGRLREAIALLRGAVALSESAGLQHIRIRALVNLAFRLIGDDPQAAMATQLEGLDAARRLGDQQWFHVLLNNAASLATALGRWDEALALLAEGDAADLPTPERVSSATARATIAAHLGQVDRAEATLLEIEPLRNSLTSPSDRAFGHLDRAFIARCRGRPTEAFDEAMTAATGAPVLALWAGTEAMHAAAWLRDLARARSALEASDDSPDRGRFAAALRLASRASVAGLEGQFDKSIAAMREAARTLRDVRADLVLAELLIDFVTVIGTERPEGGEAAAEARQILERLGAAMLLRRLDEVAPVVARDDQHAPADIAKVGGLSP